MPTVLLIDDDPEFVQSVAAYLGAAGWRVLKIDDGAGVLDLVANERPDAVVCDLMVANGGFGLCRALRREPKRFGSPRIIVANSSAYPNDRQLALEAGADAYLAKPVTASEVELLLRGTVVTAPSPADASNGLAGGGPLPGPARFKFWGVRGSIATPGPSTVKFGGNTSCVEVRVGNEIIILDAGTGIRPLGLSLVEEFGEEPLHLTILISHTHWDHIQGLPFFVPAYNSKNRIRILGYEGARRGLELTLAAQMESPYFPVGFEQMPGHIVIQELRDMRFLVGAVPISTTFLNHPGLCTGYRISTAGGSLAYLSDLEPYPKSQSPAPDSAGPDDTRVISGQKELKLAEFIRGADVLIIDCQYDAREYQRHVGWGHSCVDDSVALAIKAGVGRMFMFHHDPGHDDAKVAEMLQEAREIVAKSGAKLEVEAAREGFESSLGKRSQPGVAP